MPNNHSNFHSVNGKRMILIVEDEFINQEILKAMLNDSYELLIADTGKAAMDLIKTNSDMLSLILLDLNLPDLHGLDVLRQVKADPQTARIPIIVLTAEKDAEVESLTLGAIDFIPKPYPQQKVVLARVLRTIELSEGRDIILSTERDHLTGLYNREFFYRYAAQFDVFHRNTDTDAIVVDINLFHMINDRYGKSYGDVVLKEVGEKLRESVMADGGIVCRREADTFLVYCPHRDDYAEILENASITLDGKGENTGRISLRMGVYSHADKSIDIERRFDRAKLAADTVKNSFTKTIGIYDDALRESELFNAQLIEAFQMAIQEKQFKVFLQPKYDIQTKESVLSSAEALVRWEHPDFGMVSPGQFIPLFENNGLVQELDEYVWRQTAEYIRDWKERLGVSLPVSVNVSRIDMYDPFFVEKMEGIVKENKLDFKELVLEITESAYTEESDQIVEKVKELRELGFRIEMDDFGTGYSSLNMISTLPIDALKLDMQFVRNAFKERKDTRILEAVIQLAESLEVPTIAEGVETAEQLLALKSMGCDKAQGYYFSKPLPVEDFEKYIVENERQETERKKPVKARKRDIFTYDALHDSLTGLYNYTAFDVLLHDSDHEHIAVLLANIDDFEGIKKREGKTGTDNIVIKIADILRKNFRSVDDICRLKEDEFVVIMTRMTGSMDSLVLDKVKQVNEELMNMGEDIAPISLSVGVAFSDRENPEGDVFEDADTALNRMKDMRQSGCSIF